MHLIDALVVFAIFTVLGIIHFSWAFGGTWGLEKTLPTNESGERVLNPKNIDSAIVGFGLTFFGLFYLLKSGFLQLPIPVWVMTYGGWIIPGIFIFRAIGDFKYVGFFKKIKNTPFGKADLNFFSPLCLFIGLLGILLQLINQ